MGSRVLDPYERREPKRERSGFQEDFFAVEGIEEEPAEGEPREGVDQGGPWGGEAVEFEVGLGGFVP